MLDRLSTGLGRRVPVILQSEAAECGLACLAMVASYHGHRVDLPAVRRRFSSSLAGMTLPDLLGAAGRLGLSGRPLRVELHALGQVRRPAVLHWDFSHFVVLTEWQGDRGVIHDPAAGRRAVTAEELSRHFTGVVLELQPNAQFTRRDEREAIHVADLFRRVSGLGRALLVVLLLSVALEVFQLLVPIASQVIIDHAIVAADLDLLRLVALSVALIVVLQAVVLAARSWGLMVLGATLSVQWSASLFTHLVRLPLDFFEKRHVGDVLSRFKALDAIRETFSARFMASLMDGVMAVGLVAMMFVFGGSLTLVALGTTTAYLLLRTAAYGPYRRATEEEIVRHAREDTHFLETIRGATTVKVFGIEGRRHTAWLNLLVDRVNARLALQKLDILYGTANRLLFGLDRVLVLALGAAAVMQNRLSLGMLIAFLSYKDQFAERAASLIDAVFQLRMLRLQAERLADIALTEAETHQAALSIAAGASPRLELRGIGYRYGDAARPVLASLDLCIEPGECVVIAGPSGCGKTTALKILAGLLTPTDGELLADGAPLAGARLAQYRNGVAGVLQDDRLFAGSLLENVTVFAPDVDVARLRDCLVMAAVDADIARMPMGLETLVGDMGSTLSGGQKQRLLLARALYHRPAVLLLDEPTNHLDAASAAHIFQALSGLQCTRILVSHDERLFGIADRVHRMA